MLLRVCLEARYLLQNLFKLHAPNFFRHKLEFTISMTGELPTYFISGLAQNCWKKYRLPLGLEKKNTITIGLPSARCLGAKISCAARNPGTMLPPHLTLSVAPPPPPPTNPQRPLISLPEPMEASNECASIIILFKLIIIVTTGLLVSLL